jgi:hypothetical protein
MFLVPTMARAEEVTTIVTQGGDDSSYQIPLTTPVVYDGTTYQNVYATTNSVITFGNPDGTYWTYPQTPSISIESRDWWAYPNWLPDTHFIISTSAGGFQVDGSYLPYGTTQGTVTNIVITAQIQTDGTVNYTYSVTGPTYSDDRTGARLTDGTVVTLEEAGITQVAEPVVLEPTPVDPTPVPEPQPTPDTTPVEPTPSPTPSPSYAPTPAPVADSQPVPVEPTPVVDESPTPVVDETSQESIPTETTQEQTTPIVEPTPEPPVVEEPIVTDVTLDNGVVLTAQQAETVALLQSPGQLLTTIFTNPAEAVAALFQVGVDMSPEARAQSEKIVVSAVIAGQIAQTAVSAAAGAANYRRKID